MTALCQHDEAFEMPNLPVSFSKGEEITDNKKNTYILRDIIGSGSYGAVYTAANKEKPRCFDYAIKIGFAYSNAIHSEIFTYRTTLVSKFTSYWIEEKKLSYLGLPEWYGFGYFKYDNLRYHFIVLKRYGTDLQKLLVENGTFPLKTVCLIGISVIDALEYMHAYACLHNDVKAVNLVLGREKGTENQVYLVDMDLVTGFGFEERSRGCTTRYNGTVLFQSRDAHRGCASWRSDLEILAYNLLLWLTGGLPWENDAMGVLESSEKLEKVGKEKNRCMNDIDNFLEILFHGKVPDQLSKLLHYINNLLFTEEPDYAFCQNLLKEMLKSAGYSDTDRTLEFTGKSKVPQEDDANKEVANNKIVVKKIRANQNPLKKKRKLI